MKNCAMYVAPSLPDLSLLHIDLHERSGKRTWSGKEHLQAVYDCESLGLLVILGVTNS